MESARLHLEAQAWRMALRGLCVGSEQNLVTPEQCAANVRARLNKMGAGPAFADSSDVGTESAAEVADEADVETSKENA